MNSSSQLLEWLGYAPQLIVSIVGICLAIGYMSTHRKTAVLVLIAMSLNIVARLAWPVFRMLTRDNPTADTIQYFQLLSWVTIAISTAATVLMLIAAFSNRQSTPFGGFDIHPTAGQGYGGPPTPPPMRR